MNNLCYDCPRNCGVDRKESIGFCRAKDKIVVAKIIENFMWEEPCISGEKGALAIFFSGCNLRCKFCQNYKISHTIIGKEYTPLEFFNLLKSYDLSRFSCIDLITPSHFSSLLLKALSYEKLPIPIVWNSGGYEKPEIIEKLSSVVDVFLPDLKYFSNELSKECSQAPDYFKWASESIMKMRSLKKDSFFNGIMTSGLIIRHLVLPDEYRDSMKLLKFISEKLPDTYISLMSQFTPVGDFKKRKIYPLEYKLVLSYAEKLGLNKGYMQDFSSSNQDFIPNFDEEV